jgi:hypothetical protein
VELTTPCATNTPKRTPTFRLPNFSGRKIAGNTSKQGESTGGKENQLEEPFQEIIVKYLHHTKVVVQHNSKW